MIKKLLIILFLLSLVGTCTIFEKHKIDSPINTTIKTDIDFSELSMAVIGDSITVGTQADMSVCEKPYPTLVKELLGLKRIYNYGSNGSTLSNHSHNSIYYRYTYMARKIGYVDIIGVLGGVNDYAMNHPLGTIKDIDDKTIYGALKGIARGLQKKYDDSFIFFMTPYKCDREPKGYELEDVANAIKEVCYMYKIPVLDLYSLNDFDPKTNSGDGLHPNQEFFINNTAPTIVEFIKNNYKQA